MVMFFFGIVVFCFFFSALLRVSPKPLRFSPKLLRVSPKLCACVFLGEVVAIVTNTSSQQLASNMHAI